MEENKILKKMFENIGKQTRSVLENIETSSNNSVDLNLPFSDLNIGASSFPG